MFAWLALALFVDGIDGTIARALQVADAEQRYSGETLDLIVDYLTYVFVPAYAILAGGLLPDTLAVALAAAILVSSAFYFADREMKTADGAFKGFPALWNIAAFLMFALATPPWANAATVVALVGLTFAPIVAIHPLRTRRFRPITLGVLAVWSLAAALVLWHDLAAPFWVKAMLAGASAYIFVIGFFMGSPRSASERSGAS